MAGDLARPKQPSSAHFITYLLVGPHLYTRMTRRHTGTKDNSETLLGALGLRKKEMLRQCSARARLTTVCGIATRARSSLLGGKARIAAVRCLQEGPRRAVSRGKISARKIDAPLTGP